MEKMVIASKFAKSGKRVLKKPLSHKSVCAPAHRKYKGAFVEIDREWKEWWSAAKRRYIERMAHEIATYLSGEPISDGRRYQIINNLAIQVLEGIGPQPLEGHGGSARRISRRFGDLSALDAVEERLWNEYASSCRFADYWREAKKEDIQRRCLQMQRELLQEVEEHISPVIRESRRKTKLKMQQFLLIDNR